MRLRIVWRMEPSEPGQYRGCGRSILLAECEAVNLGARGEEGDLERAVGDRSRLADQLMEPWPVEGSVALFVYVEPVSVSWSLAVYEYAEGD